MTRLRFLLALAVTVMCFILLVGSDATVTPVRNTILIIVYLTAGSIAAHYMKGIRK